METDKSMTRPVLRRPDDDNDGLVALPPVPLVRQRLRSSVKDFAILPRDLTVEEGELTPSLKVKRRVVEKKYAALLDKFYEGSLKQV